MSLGWWREIPFLRPILGDMFISYIILYRFSKTFQYLLPVRKLHKPCDKNVERRLLGEPGSWMVPTICRKVHSYPYTVSWDASVCTS